MCRVISLPELPIDTKNLCNYYLRINNETFLLISSLLQHRIVFETFRSVRSFVRSFVRYRFNCTIGKQLTWELENHQTTESGYNFALL